MAVDTSDVFGRAVARKKSTIANDPVQSPYSPGATPLPPGSPTPSGPSPAPAPPSNPYVAPPTPDTETNKHLENADWAAAFFGSLGLPKDVVEQVNKLFTQYSDVNAASAAALGYIRGTSWYATTYPGIAEGIQKGLVSNEADYRNLLNQQSQVYKQYLGRDVTSAEFASNLGEGVPLSTVGGRLQGAALAGTYGNDWRYKLGAFDTAPTDAEVTALGQEGAGLDSALGQQVKKRLDLAQQRLAGVFSGSLATPNLSLINGRLSAPGLAAPKADLAA